MSLKSIRHAPIKEQCTSGQIPAALKMHVFMQFFKYLNMKLRYKILKKDKYINQLPQWTAFRDLDENVSLVANALRLS